MTGPSRPESKAPVVSFQRSKAVGAGFVWLALILPIVVVACGQSASGLSDQDSKQAPRQMEGLVVEVVARDIEQLETLRVKDSGGKI